jgi:plastocyanin
MPSDSPSARWVGVGALLAALTIGLSAPGASQPGRITGVVRLHVKSSARPLPTSAYGWQISSPGVPEGEMANVLVWLKNPPAGAVPPPMRAELRQRGEMFVPHTVAVTVGSVVTFPNDDPLFHNVFSLSRAGTFDLGRYPRGDSRQRQMSRPGIVKVFCHLHSHMNAIIAVFDHSWFARVSPDGTFAIDNVPAGTHVLTGWHERAGHAGRSVTVEPGGTARVELIVPIRLEDAAEAQ